MLPSASYGVYAAALLALARAVNRELPAPYMDEVFHIPQAQAYCRGEWTTWDPALTTPPGLYLPAALAARAVPAWTPTLCSPAGLRSINVLVLLLLPFVYASLLATIRFRLSKTALSNNIVRLEALSISCFPLVFFFGGLFYTDLGGLLLMLGSYRLALGGCHSSSALLGAGSLLFRQTNIVWIGFVAATAVVQRLESVGAALHNPSLAKMSLADLVRSPASLVRLSLANLSLLVPILLAYVPVFLAAAGFVIWNGGIVLGDKTNHVPTVHLPQLLYFVAFTAVFMLPILFSTNSAWKALAGLTGTPLRTLGSVGVIAIMWWCIEHHTIAHPFLLADNRHYAFYVWRRVINPHPLMRYALAPGYLFAARLLWDRLVLSDTIATIPFLVSLVAIAATLVPSPLIEPRYFVIPFVLLRLHLRPAGATAREQNFRVAVEAACFALVNAGTVAVFLRRGFAWPGTEGVQRFMW